MAAMNTTPTIRRPTAPRLMRLALACGLVLSRLASAQQFELMPGATVLVGEPLQIALSGLPKDAEITVTARRSVPEFTGGQRVYSALARYSSGARGRIDLGDAVPLVGSSYRSADVRGLFWAMTPVAGTQPLLPEGEVQLEARQGDTVLARQTLHLQRSLPAVVSKPAEPFPGAVFASLPGTARRPALILLGGSEGGSLITRDAAVWASRGYAVLALPYYSPGGWSANGPTPPELPALPPGE
jgi:Acyl-CoA thioester hydrolase/BAAT N-terminal region